VGVKGLTQVVVYSELTESVVHKVSKIRGALPTGRRRQYCYIQVARCTYFSRRQWLDVQWIASRA